jgi:hypothetical protein
MIVIAFLYFILLIIFLVDYNFKDEYLMQK